MQRTQALAIAANKSLMQAIINFNYSYTQTLLTQAKLDYLSEQKIANSYLKRYNFKFDFLSEYDRICLLDDECLKLTLQYLSASLISPHISQSLFADEQKLILSYIDSKIYDFTVNFSCYYFTEDFLKLFYQKDLKQALLSLDSLALSCVDCLSSLFSNDYLKVHILNRLNNKAVNYIKIDTQYAARLFLLFKRALKDQESLCLNYFH